MARYTTTTTALAALLATTSLASAGGIERNAFTTGILFEEGNYVELGFTYVDPTVSGQANAPYPGTPASGDMSADSITAPTNSVSTATSTIRSRSRS